MVRVIEAHCIVKQTEAYSKAVVKLYSKAVS
jgi:hypothetical protein